ncbi:MAG: hypothetical protein U9R47_00360 [Actinomycetota bacterium]|nr:hypothetical protein [Actinomycetota bacterium]
MSDHDPIRKAAIEGLDPVMDRAPDHPEWESLQFEDPRAASGVGRWWAAAVAATVVLVVGAGLLFVSGSLGDDTSETAAGSTVPLISSSHPLGEGIGGVWVLESYEAGGREVRVEPAVNTARIPWIEFHETFSGYRESFAAADGEGTAGTFAGDAGCNKINHGYSVAYEYSAGFLVLDTAIVEAGECDYEAENAMLSMLWNTPDGIEVLLGGDTMTWHGSNLHGDTMPLTFRRAGAPPTPHPEDPPPVVTDRIVKVFDIDGLEVVTMTELGELPNRVEKVEFVVTIIDSGSGPMICTGGVADSLPPQCAGPIVDGLDMSGWSDEAQGVSWGDRTVIVTWPPIDGHVRLIEDSEPHHSEFVYPPGELPSECAGIESFVSSFEVNEYARGLGARNGDLYLTNDNVIVLQVVGDPQEHRDALASGGRQACVIEVERSAAEQRALLDSIVPRLSDLVGPFGASTGPGGRVEIQVAVADYQTVEAIANLVEDRTALRVVGMGVLLP